MGIFDLFKKKPVTATDNFQKAFPDHEAQQERLKYQNHLLELVNSANAKFAKDGDLDSIIKVYEHAFYESAPPCNSSQNLKLVDFYLKKGYNDKAWGYLNFLTMHEAAPIDKIRHEQVRILKKEKRYIYALEMIMHEHLHKSELINAFNREHFIKDARVCIRALKWEDISESLADMIDAQVKKQNYYDSLLSESYYAFLKQKGLFKEVDNGQC